MMPIELFLTAAKASRHMPDNNSRPIVPQYYPEADVTPINLLEEGDAWAVDSFTQWMRADEQEQELTDLLIERQSDASRDTLRKKWQDWVYEKLSKGESHG